MNTARVMPEWIRFKVTNSVSIKVVARFPLSHSEIVQLAEHGLEQGKYK